ncbi:ATP/GTP-binding protein [Adlercreutzia sp. ZJ242]|uniref:AAA family ATPase n=1 Tax=Adlercreutzia sp. ZJ242 TaxID=2709409 RepID=UPI0013EB2BE9|nr:ATP-binding protein [Adlercreutzia sp. ZJ242]
MTRLLSLEIENFRSFRKAQTINFGDLEGRRITALYGANACGKSNVIKALKAAFSCIVNSSSANWNLPYEPFLLKQGNWEKPTRFSLKFEDDRRLFIYEFSFDHDRVVGETLWEQSSNSLRRRTVFSRDAEVNLNSTAAKNKFGKRLQNKTRPETLIITKAREDNNEYANIVFNLLSSVSIIDDNSSWDLLTPRFVGMLRHNESLKGKTVSLLQKCDIAIRDIAFSRVPISESAIDSLPIQVPSHIKKAMLKEGGTEFKTLHAVRDEEDTVVGLAEFDFASMESMGTQKFFEVAVPIIDAIETGKTLFIDEFSSYIHPVLARAIISMFRSQSNDSLGASLVLITHNTSIMSDLGRDEMAIVEKTLGEESRILTFAEAGARKDDSFERRYNAGYYGGIPFIKE